MKSKDSEIFNELANSYIQAQSQSNSCDLKKAEIVERAKDKLKKKPWKEWLKDSRVSLKSTQAKKLIAVSVFCKEGGQSTDLFNKEGIEKTYIIAQIEDSKIKEDFLLCTLNEQMSTKELKQSIKLAEEENLSSSEALKKVRQNIKDQKKTKGTKVSFEEFNQLKQLVEALQEENGNLKKENEDLKNSPSKYEQKNEKNERDRLPKGEKKNTQNEQLDLRTLCS